jgi:hypothetical protein
LSNCSPHALLEVKNAFNSTTGPSLISLVSNLNHTLHKKDDQEGDAVAKKDWGVSVVEEDGTPAALKEMMMKAVLAVDKARLLATKRRDDEFFHRIFINRMSTDDAQQQVRTDSSSQHVWHADGDQTAGEQHLTCVFTLCGAELDSDSLLAHDVGGFLKSSNFDDGRCAPSCLGRPNLPKPSSTVLPKDHNSFHTFPGCFVSHGVFKMKPGMVRCSIVMFVKL